jgi:hypothetical protein
MCTNPSWWTPTSDEGAERGDIRHDTFKNHAGLQILELLHSLAKACRLENRARIMPGFLEFLQDVGDGRHAKDGIGERLRFERA